MTELQIFVLALVQGLTEFLPISSSAHLILASELGVWADQGLAFDVAVHLGSLAAVIIYLRKDLIDILLRRQRLAVYLAIASVPALAAGLLFHNAVATTLRTIWVILIANTFFALLLALADRMAARGTEWSELGARRSLAIGCAQALALIPGTSRSGITITAGLMLGLSRSEAARFSFLLAIPLILAAGGYDLLSLARGQSTIAWREFALGAIVAGITAFICIGTFLRFVERVGMMPFVIYRLILSGVIAAYLLLG